MCPYKRQDFDGTRGRYCAMNDFTNQIIYIEGGAWTETEVLGNRAIVKVRASASTLAMIAGTTGFKRLPKDLLNSPLSDLTSNQKQKLKDEILDMGYLLSEFSERFENDLGTYTLRDVLKFMAKRRLKPRYDSGSDTIILDGAVQPVRSLESVDKEVT